MSLFKLKGQVDSKTKIILTTLGFAIIFLIWFVLTYGKNPIVNLGILPKPFDVLLSFSEMWNEHELAKNACRSIGLNLAGYVEAILIAIPIGFLTGLIPFFRGTFKRQIDAFRFVPLTAVTGIFIMWFGLGVDMKVHFLAFGILIYLLPVVVQRIDEIDEVYYKTVFTLGANSWQIIKTVYFPAAMAKLSDDIRVLTAISWTYIIIAEMLGSQGGLGDMIWKIGRRQGRMDILFGLLIIIVLIGFLQDRLFSYLDREFFPHKYTGDAHKNTNEKKSSFNLILNYFGNTFLWVSLAGYLVLFINEAMVFLEGGRILSELFGGTVWIIHSLVLVILIYKIRKLIVSRKQEDVKKATV